MALSGHHTMGLNGHLSIRDCTPTSCQKGSNLHINSPIIELSNGLLIYERVLLQRRCVHTNRITRVTSSTLWKYLFAHTVAVIIFDYVFRKRTIHCLYLHFSYIAFSFFLNNRSCEYQLMEQPGEQPSYCDFKLCGKKTKRTRCINILIMKIYHINFSYISKTL